MHESRPLHYNPTTPPGTLSGIAFRESELAVHCPRRRRIWSLAGISIDRLVEHYGDLALEPFAARSVSRTAATAGPGSRCSSRCAGLRAGSRGTVRCQGEALGAPATLSTHGRPLSRSGTNRLEAGAVWQRRCHRLPCLIDGHVLASFERGAGRDRGRKRKHDGQAAHL
jgi:hypothetical protein